MKKPDFDTWCREYAEARMIEEYGSEDLCLDEDAYYGFLEEAGVEYFMLFGQDED